MKLPDFLRPVIGSIAGGVAATVVVAIADNVPIVGPMLSHYVTPEAAAGVATTWVIAHLFKQAVNVKVNPTNAAAPSLSATKPAVVIPKDNKPSGI